MAEEGLEDKDSKTEQPTERRLEDALKEGRTIYSREVTSFLILMSLGAILIWIVPSILPSSAMCMRNLFEGAHDVPVDSGHIGKLLIGLFNKVIIFLAPFFIAIIAIPLFSVFIQQGQFVFSTKQIEPQLSRISIGAGAKRIFSMRSVIELLKSIFKIAIIGTFLFLIIKSDIIQLKMYQDFTIGGIIQVMQSIIKHVLLLIIVSVAVIAGIDYSYQRYNYFQSLRMSKHDIKEEHKKLEGNPEVKSKQRSLQYKARQRMMANVPKADVVITNPEHYAVAIQYDQAKMNAPRIVAKGMDDLAHAIMRVAEDNKVVIHRDPPLARSLYKVEVGNYIKPEHYKAVALILHQIQKKKNATKG